MPDYSLGNEIVWQPAGFNPIAFVFEPLGWEAYFETAERQKDLHRQGKHVEATQNAVELAILKVTAWRGLKGDPECNEKNKRAFFSAPQRLDALTAVYGGIVGSDRAGATEEKKSSEPGSASDSPTPGSTVKPASTPTVEDTDATIWPQ